MFGLAFGVALVALLCLIFWLMSLLSGWQELAKRFHHRGKFRGECNRFKEARLDNYRLILDMGINEDGLYLVPTFPFRLFHKPLLIPWIEITAEPFKGWPEYPWRYGWGYRVSFLNHTLMLLDGDFYDAAKYLKGLKDYRQPEG